MLNKIDQEIAFVRSALNVRAQRQELLASNMANSDTPNYKAKDLDFSAALTSALGAAGGKGGALSLARTQSRHIDGKGSGLASRGVVQYRTSLQPSLDGNTVDVDVERAHFTENSLHYQFLLDRAVGQFKTLGMALTDR